MSLQRYSARKIIARQTSELHTMLTGEFIVLFDDGVEVVMKSQEVIFSSYFWDIHRQLPWLPLNSDHCVTAFTKKGLLTSNTHIKFAERVFWFVVDTATAKGIKFETNEVDALNEVIYRKSNDLYNYACTELESAVISTDLEDYYELLNYPPIKKIVDLIQATEESIASVYLQVTEIIMKDPTVATNALVVSARSGMVRMGQLLQCIICRGFVTDIDSMIFPEPSMGSFVEGYKDYYSLFIDTRTAAKSLFFSAKLLRMTEYNSRKLQILCQSVQTVHPGDCGSKEYLHFLIKGNEYNPDGSMAKKGDIERFAGLNFLDEETNQLRELKPEDSKYIGKVLRFRSPLAGCAHPDPHGVCSICFGGMYKVIPEHTNIGYMLAAALMQILSQSILSVKHVDTSSSSALVLLTPYQSKYLEIDVSGKAYHFNRGLVGKRLIMTVNETEMSTIASLQNVDNFDSVVPSHFSDLSMTVLEVGGDDTYAEMESVGLDLSSEKRNAFFTTEALAYIKQKGWIKRDKNVILDFTDWDNTKPFAALPQRHFNNADHAKDIAELIQGRSSLKDDKNKRKQDGTVVDYFTDFYNMVNSRLDVPAVILMHIIYGASIRDSAAGDYRLPRANTRREMGLSAKTVPARSMGAAMGYEYHVRELFQTTQGFDPKQSSSHPMDVFVMPNEATKDAKRRGIR